MHHVRLGANYRYTGGTLNDSHSYLLPSLIAILSELRLSDRRIFELGCGNGSVAAELTKIGYEILGIDASPEAITQANRHHPSLRLESGSAYDDLHGKYGQFPAVISLEVVEHLYAPREYATAIHNLLLPGGTAIISTPYHGYWKNLALALTGRMDRHFTALWDHGHIKFWSQDTLSILLQEAGFVDLRFHWVGRVSAFAKSMIVTGRKARS